MNGLVLNFKKIFGKKRSKRRNFDQKIITLAGILTISTDPTRKLTTLYFISLAAS